MSQSSTLTSAAPHPHRQGMMLPTAITLARWQFRNIWRLLLFLALGVVASVILACLIPLYSWITTSTQLRSIFTTSPTSNYISAEGSSKNFSKNVVGQISQQVDQQLQLDLGPYLLGHQQLITILPALSFATPQSDPAGAANFDKLQFQGYDLSNIAPHITLLQGRLPQQNSAMVELLLTPSAAKYLGVGVGSILSIGVPHPNFNREYPTPSYQMRVVGLFQQVTPSDPYWHNTSFTLIERAPVAGAPSSDVVPVLGSTTALLNAFDRAYKAGTYPYQLFTSAQLIWNYQIDLSRLDSDAVGPLTSGVSDANTNLPIVANMPPYITDIHLQAPLDQLQYYQGHFTVTQFPILILTALVIGLLIFFVSLMIDLLVDRQTSTFALLRSRGASRTQIFFAPLIQFLVLGLLAVAAGALLALPLVSSLAQHTLTADEQGLLQALTSDPLALLSRVQWQLLSIVVVLLITMLLTTYRATRLDVLALRRESARTTRQPFWQRFYLDIAIMLLAAIGYGSLFYIIHSGVLDPATRVLVEAPLFLLASVCLLLASALLFLRLFPLLLHLGMRLANRRRGITPVLSLELLSRSPMQATRMILLLTFALAFIIFAQMFSLSQSQHIQDVATYTTGADISGQMFNKADGTLQGFLSTQAAYQRISDVISAAAGAVSYGYLTASGSSSQTSNADLPSARILAIDPATFAAATLWEHADVVQQLSSAFQQLIQQRAHIQQQAAQQQGSTSPNGNTHLVIPAIVDAVAWNSLHLSIGTSFTLYGNNGSLTYQVVGHTGHLPTVNDEVAIADHGEAGLLVDYQSLLAVTSASTTGENSPTTSLAANYAWLHVQDSTSARARVIAALKQGSLSLSPLLDRHALVDQMAQDSLYLVFVNVLSLGALAPVLLALLGNLLFSWASVRRRLVSFAVLRAMGTSVMQLTQLLSWEQGIIYGTALLLGLLFGILLGLMTLPSLTFTNLPIQSANAASSFALQNVPPIHVALPFSLILILLALIMLCIVSLVLMVRVSTRPLLGKTLRLNED